MAEFFAVLKSGAVRRILVTREVQVELGRRFDRASSRLRRDVVHYVALDASGFQPDETEALYVEPFHLPRDMRAAFENPIGCPALGRRDIEEVGIKAIAGSFFDMEEPWIGFQVRDRGDVLSAAGFSLILDGETYRRLLDPGLIVGDDLHVVLTGDRLVFARFWWGRQVFELREYYFEATDGDLEAFVNRADVVVEDPDEFIRNRNAWERKRIGAVIASGILDTVGLPVIRDRALEYGVPLQVEARAGGHVLHMPSDHHELREVLQFLEEKIYRGPLTDTEFVTNSRRPRERDV